MNSTTAGRSITAPWNSQKLLITCKHSPLITDTLYFQGRSEVNEVVHDAVNLSIFLNHIFTICTYLQSISKLSCHQADGNNGNNFGFVSFLANFYSLMVSLGSTGPCQLISFEKWGQSPLHLHRVYNISTFINPKSSQSRVGAGCLRWQQRQVSSSNPQQHSSCYSQKIPCEWQCMEEAFLNTR